jgi:hypothetical protein
MLGSPLGDDQPAPHRHRPRQTVVSPDELERDDAIVLRKKMSLTQVRAFAPTTPRTIVAMEACGGSQNWGRVFTHAGHETQIAPAQFVKPYVKTNKNDFNDAEAIAEAASRATMRFVRLKTTEQLELQELTAILQMVYALCRNAGTCVRVNDTRVEQLTQARRSQKARRKSRRKLRKP